MKVVSRAEMVATIRWRNALRDYVVFNDRRTLDALHEKGELITDTARRWLDALDSGEIKRPRGIPPRIRHTPEQIVQLVFKQKLQAGRTFSNEHGEWGDLNPCFYAVADNLHCSTSQVRRHWRSVPKERRAEIARALEAILRDEDLIHPRHQ